MKLSSRKQLVDTLTLLMFVFFNSLYPASVTSGETSPSFPEADFPQVSILPNLPISGDRINLSSKNCTHIGDDSEGSLTCRGTYSNGESLVLTSDYETFASEFKRQTRISTADPSGHEKESKTIRQKTRYAYLGQEKVKEAEFFDIVRRPLPGKVTREIFLYEYHLETQQIKTATWTLYNQIGSSSSALLSYHAFLAYDPHGNFLSGSVDKYRDGIKVEELYRWDRTQNGTPTFDPTTWKQWGDRILKPLQERILSPENRTIEAF